MTMTKIEKSYLNYVKHCQEIGRSPELIMDFDKFKSMKRNENDEEELLHKISHKIIMG